MAYAALISLSQSLDQIPDRHQHSFVARHEEKQLRSLRNNIVFLSTFLEDFPREAGNLEARITDAANQAEDILEYHVLEKRDPIIRKPHSSVLNCLRQVSLSPQISGHNLKKLYKELRLTIKEIGSISEEAMQMKSRCIIENRISSYPSASFRSRIAPHVVGFEQDLIEIKERLCGESFRLEAIPIVGMGGIGKTTLARYAFDDPLTLHRFDVRAWMTISQTYVIQMILLRLLYSIDASAEKLFDENTCTDTLCEHVYKYLKGRRYLIVIDDIWNGNVWDAIRMVFPDDVNGSRIIITTRDLDVASYVDSSTHPHEMHLMSVEQSWNLLRYKVFGEEHCPHELEETGKRIAEKCRGLPLALLVIAGVLSKVDQTRETWYNIAGNINEIVNTSDDPFAEILALSYTCLPHYLRPCFLYMGAFPEDHEINVSKLVKLWAAEGFLKHNGPKELEGVGEDYLEDLAKRSLVLISEKRYNGEIKNVKIHDLLRDLCLRKAYDEKFLHVISKFSMSITGVKNWRRVSILSHFLGGLTDVDDALSIHTILLLCDQHLEWWQCFRLLRVVDARRVTMTRHADAIGELLHLRFLAVKLERHVPESWSKLKNLQTLIITSEFPLTSCMAFAIWRLPRLRNVILSDALLPDPSGQPFALGNLHTLKGINSFTCSEDMLRLIPNLKKLGIIYTPGYKDKAEWSKFCLINLVHLYKLDKLNLYAFPIGYSHSSLSQNIAFPLTLKKLS